MNRRVTLLYVLFQVGFILALMTAGWGGLGLFDEPAVVGVLACMVLGAFTILHTGVELERLNEPAELWGLLSTLLLAAFFFYFLPLADRQSWFVIIPGHEARYTGLLLFAIGTGARTMGFLTRREKMSATGLFPLLDERSFVERSIYLRTRHPQYLGLILQSFGFALVFRNWLGLVAAMVMVSLIIARVEAEERILRERLGERYEQYLKRTWRFLPGIY